MSEPFAASFSPHPFVAVTNRFSSCKLNPDLQSSSAGADSSFPVLRRVVRPIHLATQAVYVSASDGEHYVVSVPETRHASGIFFRQSLGCLLGTYLRLPMTQWSPLTLSAEALGCEKAPRLEHYPEAFPLFGSRIPVISGAMYEYLPASWVRNTEIAKEFIRIQVFDNWVAQSRPRQYVAFHHPESGRLQIRFMGSASLLMKADELVACDAYEKAIVLGVHSTVVDEMVERIGTVMRSAFERLVNLLPRCWVSAQDVESAYAMLNERQLSLLRMQKPCCGRVAECRRTAAHTCSKLKRCV